MANPWLDRRILNWAHQGGAKEGPSSTLWAMRRAVEAGADAIELDVHATVDGHVVVCHDPTVDRTTNRSGAIADLTLAEVKALDNAYWWVPGTVVDHDAPPDAYVHRGKAPEDPDFAIPTLDEVLEAFPGVFLNFDIKQSAPLVPAYEQLVADALRRHGRGDDVIIASFRDATTDAFSAIAPEFAVSMGEDLSRQLAITLLKGETWTPTRHVAIQVPFTLGDRRVVDANVVERVHELGMAVHVWTIDDPDEMEELVDLGVDGIMTDCPSLLEEVLQRRGVTFQPGG